jgi:hypothetical protein
LIFDFEKRVSILGIRKFGVVKAFAAFVAVRTGAFAAR